MTKEHYIVLPLLAFVVLTMGFVAAVSYSTATFSGSARPVPDPLALQNLSEPLAQKVAIISENLGWSVETAFEAVKSPALAYLGISQNETSAAPSPASALSPRSANSPVLYTNPEVLGTVYANPAYIHSTISPSSQ